MSKVMAIVVCPTMADRAFAFTPAAIITDAHVWRASMIEKARDEMAALPLSAAIARNRPLFEVSASRRRSARILSIRAGLAPMRVPIEGASQA
jgi:hypothetical protein